MENSEPLPKGWTRGYVETNGIETCYVRTGGDGPPVVIAHGVFDDGPCRSPLARDLEDDYDVILYDARGHGRSDAPPGGYDPDTRGADLLALLDALDVEDPYLFGHSMGGDTVAAAAARRPDLPRAVAMADPAAMLEHDEDGEDRVEGVREQIAWWHDRTKTELLTEDDELRGHVEAGNEWLAALLADARLRVSPNVVSVFQAGWLDPETTYARIDAPTLLLRADGDEDRRARDRERAAHLPDGRLRHVDDAGHCLFRDERETATRELRAFFEGA